MHTKRRRPFARVLQAYLVLFLSTGAGLPGTSLAQGLTGALIGTVKDAQGGAVGGALVRLTSAASIGGSTTLTTDKAGLLRFPALPPGEYVLNVTMRGFGPLHEQGLRIGAGVTLERTIVLELAGLAESVVVEGAGSRTDARDPGFGARFGPEELRATPTRRASMFDFIRAAEGTSPGWGPAEASAITVPVLVIGGVIDRTVPPSHLDALYEALPSNQKVRVRMDCASHASLWEGSAAASGWGGPHATMQTAVIEWLTTGTYQGFTIGQFRTLADGTPVIE